MKITKITQQLKNSDRYAIYVDGAYAFSLSSTALLEAKLASGQELTDGESDEFAQLASFDKLYNQALRYVALRLRSTWEVQTYLARKKAPSPLQTQILSKLSNIGMLSDTKYAEAFVANRRLLRPYSRRKIIMELKKKRIPEDIILLAVGSEASDEEAALAEIITTKRRQTKYQDDMKLMQYLARQGFSYGSIKSALAVESQED